jgi:hypothetical protein
VGLAHCVFEVHGGPASAAASMPPLELDDDPLLEPDEDEEPLLEPDEPLLDEASLAPSAGESRAESPPPLELEELELELDVEAPDDDPPDEPLAPELPLDEVDTVLSPPPSSLEVPLGVPLLPPHPIARVTDTPAHRTRQVRSFLMARTSAGSVYLASGSGPKKSGDTSGRVAIAPSRGALLQPPGHDGPSHQWGVATDE